MAKKLINFCYVLMFLVGFLVVLSPPNYALTFNEIMSNTSLYWVIVNATSLTTANFNTYNVHAQPFDLPNTYIIWGDNSSYEASRAQVMADLFYDGKITSDASGISSIKTKDSRDIGRRAFYANAYISSTTEYPTGINVIGTFNTTSDNDIVSIWEKITLAGGTSSNIPAGKVEMPLLNVLSSSTVNYIGKDRTAAQQTNPANLKLNASVLDNGGFEGTCGSSTVNAIILSKGNITWQQTGSSSVGGCNTYQSGFTNFLQGNNIPAFTEFNSTPKINSITLSTSDGLLPNKYNKILVYLNGTYYNDTGSYKNIDVDCSILKNGAYASTVWSYGLSSNSIVNGFNITDGTPAIYNAGDNLTVSCQACYGSLCSSVLSNVTYINSLVNITLNNLVGNPNVNFTLSINSTATKYNQTFGVPKKYSLSAGDYLINMSDNYIFIQEEFSVGTNPFYNFSYDIDYGIDNCSNSFRIASNASALNVSFYNMDGSRASVDFDAIFNYGGSTSTQTNTFSHSKTSNNFSMCIYPSWANIYADYFISYSNNSYQIENILFSNSTQLLNLYLQSGTTPVLLKVLDYSTNPVQDAYIYVQKWDSGTNSYLATETLRTDVNGEAIGNLILVTEWYRFIVVYQNETILIDPETQGVKLYTTTRTFKISLTGQEWFENYNDAYNIYGDVEFNNQTNYFTFTWLDTNNNVDYGCLKVIKRNATKTVTLDDSCVSSTTATMTYHITPVNGSNYIATGYFRIGENSFVVDTEEAIFSQAFTSLQDHGKGEEAVFYAILLIMSLTLIGVPFPELSFILFIVGIIASFALKLWLLSTGLIIGIIVLGAIQMYMSNRK